MAVNEPPPRPLIVVQRITAAHLLPGVPVPEEGDALDHPSPFPDVLSPHWAYSRWVLTERGLLPHPGHAPRWRVTPSGICHPPAP